MFIDSIVFFSFKGGGKTLLYHLLLVHSYISYQRMNGYMPRPTRKILCAILNSPLVFPKFCILPIMSRVLIAKSCQILNETLEQNDSLVSTPKCPFPISKRLMLVIYVNSLHYSLAMRSKWPSLSFMRSSLFHCVKDSVKDPTV